MSALPPAQPAYVLRGHAAAIHTLLFFRTNTRLLTGDADGWAVIWSVPIKRPVAVWRAHTATILGAALWDEDKLVTHGRDGKICVWSFSENDEGSLSTELPVKGSLDNRKQPWLLHMLEIPTLNFCSFASCAIAAPPRRGNEAQLDQDCTDGQSAADTLASTPTSSTTSSLLLAVAGSNDSQIELYRLPDEQKVAVIPAPEQVNTKTGMVMALKVFRDKENALYVIAGYESGRTYLFKGNANYNGWETMYTACPHSQPILSLDISPLFDVYYTSSADAVIAKHPLLQAIGQQQPIKEVQTRHSGQQGLKIRTDGKIFATAGWDRKARVYSAKTVKELAVLKWHKEGCYAIAFGEVSSAGAGASVIATEMPTSTTVTTRASGGALQSTVGQARLERTQKTHWLAVGSKDGKVSLWDIY